MDRKKREIYLLRETKGGLKPALINSAMVMTRLATNRYCAGNYPQGQNATPAMHKGCHLIPN